MSSEELNATAAAACAAANAAASTVHAFEGISSKMDHGFERLFERFNFLDKQLAVHIARSEEENSRLLKVEKVIAELAPKVATLWMIDRAKVWAVRVTIGSVLTSLGGLLVYVFRRWMGW